ncbi:hypothetical protein HGO38_10585 [Rhizobium sp. CG5]|uniref:hypothetical protein n=1 Tax=Rhizobium sp. CG5 TaxID=2726076 RepID=UPI0020338082|nr:hypothetical protein [Rhizobium sp. CG5]MCM2473918.1 hypothetical protein [Rhizobium sp. CG5]
MRLLVALIAIGTLATPSYGQDSTKLGPNSSEDLFQCGAAFAIMAKVYQEAGQMDRSTKYQAKFEKLAAQAEDVFAQSNRSESDAKAYMQKHVDDLIAVSAKDTKLVINFSRVCDQRFPI